MPIHHCIHVLARMLHHHNGPQLLSRSKLLFIPLHSLSVNLRVGDDLLNGQWLAILLRVEKDIEVKLFQRYFKITRQRSPVL